MNKTKIKEHLTVYMEAMLTHMLQVIDTTPEESFTKQFGDLGDKEIAHASAKVWFQLIVKEKKDLLGDAMRCGLTKFEEMRKAGKWDD